MAKNQKIMQFENQVDNNDFKRMKIKEYNEYEKLSSPKKRKKKINLFNILFVAMIIYFGVTIFKQVIMINALNDQIESKNMEKAELEKTVSILKEDVAKIDNKEYLFELVEKIARNEYKMVKPNEIMYIDKDKNSNKFIKGLGFGSELADEDTSKTKK